MSPASSSARGVAILLITLVSIVFLIPILYLLASPFVRNGFSGGLNALASALMSDTFGLSVGATLKIASLTAVIGTLLSMLGAAALYVLKSNWLEKILLLSVAAAYSTLTVIRAVGVLIALSPNHLPSELLRQLGYNSLRLNSSLIGVVIGLTHFFLPMGTLYVYVGLNLIPVNLIRSGLILRGSVATVASSIIWPIIRKRVAYVFSTIFLLSVGVFVTPSVLGGAAGQMISVVIDQRVRNASALNQGLLYGALFSVGMVILGLMSTLLTGATLFRKRKV